MQRDFSRFCKKRSARSWSSAMICSKILFYECVSLCLLISSIATQRSDTALVFDSKTTEESKRHKNNPDRDKFLNESNITAFK